MKIFSSSKKYSKELEKILVNKNFSIEVNNLLLLILNHINDIYSDYKKVKINVLNKDTIIHNYFKIINNNIDSIEIIKENVFDIKFEDLGKTGVEAVTKQEKDLPKPVIDEKNKLIRTHLSPLSLYTCIIQIQPKFFYIRDEYIFKENLQNILGEASILDGIEILRDFKGFSWYPKYSKNFPFIKNIIYQDLIWLLRTRFHV